MNKKENRMAVRQTVENAVERQVQIVAADKLRRGFEKPAYHPAGTGCRGSGGQPHQVRLK